MGPGVGQLPVAPLHECLGEPIVVDAFLEGSFASRGGSRRQV